MALRHIACSLVGFLLSVTTGVADRAHAQNWDGMGQVRVGAFLQQSFLTYDQFQPGLGAGLATQSASPDGFGGGIVAGYDLRLGRFVVGGEVDLSVMSGSANTRPGSPDKYGVDYISTVRARFGALVTPNMLVYVTPGLSLLGAEYKNVTAGVLGQTGILNKKNKIMSGWGIGTGLEYDLGWTTLFGEYYFADFGSWRFQNFNGNSTTVDADAHLLRVGMKFKVGHDFGYVDDHKRTNRW
jgi:opacity protein-like surface antigen